MQKFENASFPLCSGPLPTLSFSKIVFENAPLLFTVGVRALVKLWLGVAEITGWSSVRVGLRLSITENDWLGLGINLGSG